MSSPPMKASTRTGYLRFTRASLFYYVNLNLQGLMDSNHHFSLTVKGVICSAVETTLIP